MKNLRNVFAAILAAVALTACGGGGGGGDSPATITQPVPEDSTKPVLTLATSSPASTTTTIRVTASEALGGTSRISLQGPTSAVVAGSSNLLPDNLGMEFRPETALACGTAYSGQATGGDLAGNQATPISFTLTTVACPATVYHYGAFNVTIRNDQSNTVWMVDDAGNETKLINSTGFAAVGTIKEPIISCGLYDLVLPDNRPLASCLTPAAGNTRRVFPINPPTKELMKEYTGTIPQGAVLRSVPYGTFGDTPYASKDIGNKGMYLTVPGGGVLYFTNRDPKLRLTKDDFTTNAVVNDGTHLFLWRFEGK